MKYTKEWLQNIEITVHKPSIIFLYWDLWAGKTTLSQILIQKILQKKQQITSPTYVYYNKYEYIYHFDLYRLSNYDEFVSIAGEEILDNHEGVILVEWPEKIAEYYKPDIEIYIIKTDDLDERDIKIIYKKKD